MKKRENIIGTSEKTKHKINREKRQKNKKVTALVNLLTKGRGREWRVRVKGNLKHYFLHYRLYSIYECLRYVYSIFNDSLLQQTPYFL